MRTGVLADIHGNLRALRAVLDDLATRSCDRVVNLGDCLSGPLEAAATAELLMECGFPTVRGNHDRRLVHDPPGEMNPSDHAAFAQLNQRHLAWLKAMPPALELDETLLVHGTPSSDLTYLLEEVTPQGARLASREEWAARLGTVRHAVVLCGHSHVPRVVTATESILVVNPGSVGLPAFRDVKPHPHAIEMGSPHARYAVLEQRNGGWRVDLIAVEYDWRAASAEAANAGREDWARALATGYA